MNTVHKQQTFERNQSKRNYGFGKNISFATAMVLRAAFGNGHYQTRDTHHQRFRHFIRYCQQEWRIKDIRDVQQSTLNHYLQHLKSEIDNERCKISYAQNLISTVNVVLEAFRGNDEISIPSPSKALGRRSHIRTRDPRCEMEQLAEVIAKAKSLGLERAAAVALLAFAFAMRFREAALADLIRIRTESLTGEVTILEGCKGGRKSNDRKITFEKDQQFALEYALSVKPKLSRNLLAPDEKYIDFKCQSAQRLRPILKENGIKHFHELRASRLVKIYEQKACVLPPFLGGFPTKKQDQTGRKYVALAAGHGAQRTGVSYVGGKENDQKR